MTPALAAAVGPSVYWYLARGTGAVTLLLLTTSVVLGVLGPLRVTGGRWPRFAIDTVHRDVSLLVTALLLVHIVVSVLDSFVAISLTAAVIPFISSYRPLWLGLGAVAFDIMLALVVTSLVRRRLGYRSWRAVHWLAYASFPIAVLHGLGTGSDTKIWWMLALTAACVVAVLMATCLRVARADALPGLRMPALALSVVTPVLLAGFAILGPLAHGWARRAGTPSTLLRRAAPRRPGSVPASAGALRGFSAQITGSVRQASAPGGAVVDLDLHLSGGARGRLRVRLAGTPSSGGGLSMTGSQVDLLTAGGSVMAGQISSLQGTEFVARVFDRSGVLTLRARLNIDAQTNAVTGLVSASPSGGPP
ncbi:MAG: ferric reductase-like transmembrane domain-containing protein [Actinomycetota bacterium]|nr:ferric reductase-like transmembrane domain-containing protein [Actinomycetota bacterium]